ncbi:MAG: hypothetical protein U9R57_01415 [Thermodesulfobacteriota bacterium]|nr:hypothetical protein [Thermodesulfobacteriota bacterium]
MWKERYQENQGKFTTLYDAVMVGNCCLFFDFSCRLRTTEMEPKTNSELWLWSSSDGSQELAQVYVFSQLVKLTTGDNLRKNMGCKNLVRIFYLQPPEEPYCVHKLEKKAAYLNLKAIFKRRVMKTTLKMAERRRVLKVTGFHKSLGGFGKKLLAGMGIKKGTKLEIDPAHVSQIVLQFGGKEIRLGYESLMSVVVGDRRLTELTPGELGTEIK